MGHIRLSIVGDCDIEVSGSHIAPSASHLFALLLLLAADSTRWMSRRELQELLFTGSSQPDLASHSLRQMLYRLRRMAVRFEERSSGLRLCDNQVQGPLDALGRMLPAERSLIATAELRVLPSYSPKLSPAFLLWVEELREATERELKHMLLTDMSRLRSTHSWEAVARLSATLLVLDPLNVEVAVAGAEARALIGQRYEALALIDTYLRDAGREAAEKGELGRLRARISRAVLEKDKGPLLGRHECLALLETWWMRSAHGGARLAVIVGASGVGKTRVAAEFASVTTLNGATVLHHRCDAHSADQPLSLFSHILPTLRGMRGSLGIAPHYQELLDRLRPTHSSSPTAMPLGVSLEALRVELQSALVDILEAVSSEQRLLLLVDDAHLLDSASAALLHHLSTSVNSAALLMVVCCRPGRDSLRLLELGERATSHILAPLSDNDSRDLVLALVGCSGVTSEVLERCVVQSAGNPFYLHALARHYCSSSNGFGVPVDINALASSSYLSLADTERLVLESCLLLGRFATLPRVALVTGLDELSLTRAMRLLEERSLLCLVEDAVRGPHSLLDEAIRDLIPLTVASLLHRRVARVLSAECTSNEYSTSMALAAAHSWLTSGDTGAALVLTQRCAAEAAAIGEPAAAADLLAQMVRAQLPTIARRTVLDDLIRYGDAGGSRILVVDALRDRLALARGTGEPSADVRRLELRIIEADILNGADHRSSVPVLMKMLHSADTDHDLRMQCLVSLLVIADAEYDTVLASELFEWMAPGRTSDSTNANALRAELVYHTTFGQVERALQIVDDLIRRFPVPILDEQCRIARRFASYSLYRMMRPSAARSILEADYSFMSARGIRSEALYAASLLTEIAIGEGAFTIAEHWFAETNTQLRGAVAHGLSPNSGYYSSAALFAMMQGRYDDAAALIDVQQAKDSRMRTARYEAICCALRLRTFLMKGEIDSYPDLIARLKALYRRGRALGGQDTIVELLWCASVLEGREQDASELLVTYLREYRREPEPVEWSLRHTTAADYAWIQI
jgi:DNA-binding SARP family transcriptional activator